MLIPNMTLSSVIGVARGKLVPDKNGIMMPYNGQGHFQLFSRLCFQECWTEI